MELLISAIFFAGVIFAAIYSAMLLISLWRYSLGHGVPFVITVVYILTSIGILGHALFILTTS